MQAFAKGLVSLGLRSGDTVGICSPNRAEWTTASLASFANSMITVALYDTLGYIALSFIFVINRLIIWSQIMSFFTGTKYRLGDNAVSYIINHAETKAAVVSKEKLPQVLKILGECKTLKYIIQMDPDPRYG